MSKPKAIVFAGICLMILAGVYACNSSKENVGPGGSAIIADSLFNNDHDIRKYNFGMAREEFDLGDDSAILENEKDLIVESITLKSADSIYAECSYHFEHDLFQSGEINIFSPNDSINKLVSDTLVKRLNRRYGQGTHSRGFSTWKVKSKKGYMLEIFLGDMSYELGDAVTQLQLHADLIEKPMLALKTTDLHR
jgi:hypothetical protein